MDDVVWRSAYVSECFRNKELTTVYAQMIDDVEAYQLGPFLSSPTMPLIVV